MQYDKFEFFTPPRPEDAISPLLINFYESRGWVGQVKKNGTNNLIYVSPDGSIITRTRHGEPHKQWYQDKNLVEAMSILPRGYWHVLNSELIHSKTTEVKNTNYLFDMYVYKSQYLGDWTFTERYEQMLYLFAPHVQDRQLDHSTINTNVWISNILSSDLKKVYNDLVSDEDEGIVIKHKYTPLSSKVKWMVKCRRATKNYSW